MKIALGCDHGGYELKQFIMKTLEKLGYEYEISAATLWRAAIIPISALPLPVLWLRASATAVS